jgi:hypothetical protein
MKAKKVHNKMFPIRSKDLIIHHEVENTSRQREVNLSSEEIIPTLSFDRVKLYIPKYELREGHGLHSEPSRDEFINYNRYIGDVYKKESPLYYIKDGGFTRVCRWGVSETFNPSKSKNVLTPTCSLQASLQELQERWDKIGLNPDLESAKLSGEVATIDFEVPNGWSVEQAITTLGACTPTYMKKKVLGNDDPTYSYGLLFYNKQCSIKVYYKSRERFFANQRYGENVIRIEVKAKRARTTLAIFETSKLNDITDMSSKELGTKVYKFLFNRMLFRLYASDRLNPLTPEQKQEYWLMNECYESVEEYGKSLKAKGLSYGVRYKKMSEFRKFIFDGAGNAFKDSIDSSVSFACTQHRIWKRSYLSQTYSNSYINKSILSFIDIARSARDIRKELEACSRQELKSLREKLREQEFKPLKGLIWTEKVSVLS